MKKILWLALALLMSFAFFGCSEDGASMNEDYAGTWYLDLEAAGASKEDMTDTSFVTSWIFDGIGDTNLYKGTITKLTDTTFEKQTTHEWNLLSWDEVDVEAEVVTFSLSSDGHTLTMGILDYSDTAP